MVNKQSRASLALPARVSGAKGGQEKIRECETSNVSLEMSTVNYFEARRSNLAAFNAVRLNVSTMTGSTIQTTATATTSSVIVSSLQTGTASYSTMSGSSLSASILSASTLSASTLSASTLSASTLSASTLASNTLSVSTLTVSSINSAAPAAFSTLNVSSMNAVSTITTSTLTTTSNVGVGTSAPLAVLDVNGSMRVIDKTYTALTSGTGVDIIYSGGGTLTSGTRGAGGALTAAAMSYAASGHTWYTGSSAETNAMTVASTGSVGIGITNPFSKLNIAGGNIQLGSLAEYENGTTCTEVIQFGGGYAANWTYGYAGIQGGCAGAGGGGGYGGILNFWTKVNNGSTYTGMTLNQGNVGIGTTTPGYSLDVVGTARVSGSILFGFGGTYAAGCIYTDSNWGCIIRAKTVNPAVGAFLFSNSADTHLMTITNSGFVGIGTDTPPSWGQTTICGAGNSSNSLNQLVLMNSTNNNMVLMFAMGTAAAYIQSYQQGTPGGATLCLNQLGGNVGIGLTNPSYLLHVAGSLNCSSLFVGGVAITSLGAQWTQSGSNAYYTTGSVGIGTTSPSNLLTVAQLGANYSAPVLVLDAGIAANASAGAPRGIGKPLLGIGNSSWTSGGAAGDYYGIGFGYGGATAGSFYPAEIGLYVQTTSGATQGDLVFSTRSTTANNVASERMRITGAGNVGIGTVDPSAKLHVAGATFIQGPTVGTTTTNVIGNFGLRISQLTSAQETVGQIVGQMCFHGWGRPYASSFIRCITDSTNGYDDAGALVFGTSNGGTGAVETMRITEAGYVGIGMSNPAYRLDVAGTLNCTGLYVNGSAFTGGSGATWTVSGSNAYYSSGNLGIGTNAPTENLTVYGSAIGLRNSSVGVFSIGLATGSGQFSSNAVAADSIIRSMNGNLMLQTGSGAAALYINNSTNYVGIGTTTPSTALTVVGSMTTHGQLFAVGGNTSTYYPVLIDAGPSWTTSNTYKFTVSRSSVHMDASWKGATTIIVEGHNYSWGNGADFLKYKIIGSTSGPVSWGNFVANIFEDPNSAFIVIYLRGDTTYYFTGEGCLLNNANASGATLTVPAGSYNASYAATTTVTAPFGSLVASGDYRDNIWSVGGNVGIGKSNPSQLLDVNGAINCTSFLVNGTAVATGTGSVWGVNGSMAYYTSGYVGIGTNNPLNTTPNFIGTNGGNGIDVWSTTAFDAWAKIRILCNASQFGRTTLEMIGRWENSNDAWTLNGGRNNIIFGYQTSQGSAITYVNAIQSFNGQMGFFSSGYSTANPAMMLNAIGNVGIGRVDPSQKLDVFGDGARIQVESTTGNNAVIQMKTKTNTSFMFTDQNGHFQLYANTAAQHVFIQPDPSGKVAIGNNGNTPLGTLQVGAGTGSVASDGTIVVGKTNGSTSYRNFKMGYDTDYNFVLGDFIDGSAWTHQIKLAYQAPANCIVVNSSGYVGIGTTTLNASLHVYGNGSNSSGQNVPFCITNSNNAIRWDVGPNAGAGDFIIFYNGAGVWLNHLSPSGGWNYQSDLRLKDDIAVIPNCVDTIDALRPVSYRMKSNMDSQYKTFGLIAQEVKEVLPELVNSIHDAEHGEIYGITYNGFIPILIGAVKELSAENATLHGTCATLKAANAQLTSQVASLLAWAQTQGFNA